MKSISKIISAVSLAAVMTVQSAAGVFADTLSNDVMYNSDGIISMDEVVIDESVSDENVSVEEMQIRSNHFEEGELIDVEGIEAIINEEDFDNFIEEARKNNDNAIVAELKDTSYFNYNYTNDYYYRQLDYNFKMMYDRLYEICDIYLESTLDIKNKAKDRYYVFGVQCDDYYTFDKMRAFALAFLYSNPQFFFLKTFGYSKNEDKIWFITYNGYENGEKRSNAAKNIKGITSAWLTDINKGKDLLEKESIIYKKMSAEITYEWSRINGYIIDDGTGNGLPSYADYAQTIEGALLRKSCVCAGYAKTFVYLCRQAGIQALGVAGDNHAWNMVNLYGKWYEIDVDAMDLVNEEIFENGVYHKYYNTLNYLYCNQGKNVLKQHVGGNCYNYYTYWYTLFKFPDLSSSYGQPIYIDTSIIYAANGQAIIKWENMNEKFYGSYPMEYAFYTYQNGKYTCVGTHAQITDDYGYYTFNNLKNGVNYGFLVRVKIWNNYLKKYVWTGYTSNNVKYATIQGAMNYPVITSVTTEYNSAKITWTSVPNATQYAVYTYVNGSYTCRGSTASNSFTVNRLNQGTTYGFLVRAYVNGIWSPYSTSDIRFAATLRNSDITINADEEEAIEEYNYV